LPFCLLQSEFQNISLFKNLREGGRKTENNTLLLLHTGDNNMISPYNNYVTRYKYGLWYKILIKKRGNWYFSNN